ncbi:hypothetical protein Hanom_Chr11g01018801 [Helianthus anomalus]
MNKLKNLDAYYNGNWCNCTHGFIEVNNNMLSKACKWPNNHYILNVNMTYMM